MFNLKTLLTIAAFVIAFPLVSHAVAPIVSPEIDKAHNTYQKVENGDWLSGQLDSAIQSTNQ